jgi:hypothetical protein
MADPEEESKGFQVRDRRRFTETGETRDEASAEPERKEGEASPPPEEATQRMAAAAAGRQPPGEHAPPPITLSTFLISLSTQALMLLGEIPNPVSNRMEADLEGVREVIDLIGMLKEKTRGNLDPAEARLIDKILYDLRMRYVEKVRK